MNLRPLLPFLLLGACAVETEFEPVSLPVQVGFVQDARRTEPYVPAGPLRSLLRFYTATGTVSGVDVAVPADSIYYDVELVDPHLPTSAFEHLTPRLFNSSGTVAMQPELSVYEDLDRSGDFGDADRLVGLDLERSLLYFANLEDVLRDSTTLPASQSYYEATGGRYTRFVRAVHAFQVGYYSVHHGTPINMVLNPGPSLEEERRCWARGVFHLPQDILLSRRSRLILDVSQVDTSTAAELVEQCRTDGVTDVYLRGGYSEGCERCRCGRVEELDIYLTPRSAVPPNWPCGQQLPYCASRLPLQELDPSCLEN